MREVKLLIPISLFMLASCGGNTQESNSTMESETMETMAETARVFFQNLNNGDTVTSPVHVEFGVEGMEIMPAGEIVEGTGHHHIIIDGSPVAKDVVVPADSTHIHFGKGQTAAEVPLSPGTHTLTMQFANGIHQSYGEDMSATVSVYVESTMP